MLAVKNRLPEPKNTKKLALALLKLSQSKNSEQGMSLLECLVAIVVIAVVITSFTPPIFLAVATRVQNRRAEQAIQLAQGEIDKVRRTVEMGSYADRDLPPIGGGNVRLHSAPNSAERLDIRNANNPQLYPSSATSSAIIDVNGDNRPDFYVQTYRSPGIPQNGRTVAFCLGVRVYSASAIQQNFGTLENPPQRLASLQMTTAQGSQRRRPLAAMYTSVVHSDSQNSLNNLTTFLNSNCQ
jgi:prepilin-type N-terminal cleavage/methylation domain-containing protein